MFIRHNVGFQQQNILPNRSSSFGLFSMQRNNHIFRLYNINIDNNVPFFFVASGNAPMLSFLGFCVIVCKIKLVCNLFITLTQIHIVGIFYVVCIVLYIYNISFNIREKCNYPYSKTSACRILSLFFTFYNTRINKIWRL